MKATSNDVMKNFKLETHRKKHLQYVFDLDKVVPMAFRPNRKFKRDYDRIYKQNPEAANMFLLLAEIADGNGRVVTDEHELARLFAARFNFPTEYALGGDADG